MYRPILSHAPSILLSNISIVIVINWPRLRSANTNQCSQCHPPPSNNAYYLWLVLVEENDNIVGDGDESWLELVFNPPTPTSHKHNRN
mmetsp:Transcript_29775/g.46713  ORF Transcript_29775/g.46713 Transcript_29775/m.46713 type:complete len:88 (+) Transcript_29775:98-361(+)